jgi:hypothetical protein
MNNLVSRLLPAWLLGSVLLLILAVSSCGVPSTVVGSGSSPATTPSPATGAEKATLTTPGRRLPSSTSQLSCELQVRATPIDTIGVTLHCTVSHVPSSQKTFVLHYSVQTNAGKSLVVPPPCKGALSGGSGSCTAILTSPLPQLLTRGVVSGSTQPNQYPLGPIMPRLVDAASPTSTPLPFQPHG